MPRKPLTVAALVLGLALSACGKLEWLRNLPFHSPPREEFWAFTAPWDPRSTESAVANRDKLDMLVTGWVVIDSLRYIPVLDFGDTLARARPYGPAYAMLVTTYQGSRFHPETVRALASDSALLAEMTSRLARVALSYGYRTVVLSFEGMSGQDLPALLIVVRAIRDATRRLGIPSTGITVPVGDTAAYPGRLLLSAADYLVAMVYDQHWPSSRPGPIAAPDWAARMLAVRVAEVGGNRVVAAFPFYGYRWSKGAEAEMVGFEDAQTLAQREGTVLRREPSSQTLRLVSPQGWEVWVADAVLAQALIREARKVGVSRFAFWRLGLEDATVWRSVVRR
jgi:peptidoglycan-N-acetylglucosamine deacetylase